MRGLNSWWEGRTCWFTTWWWALMIHPWEETGLGKGQLHPLWRGSPIHQCTLVFFPQSIQQELQSPTEKSLLSLIWAVVDMCSFLSGQLTTPWFSLGIYLPTHHLGGWIRADSTLNLWLSQSEHTIPFCYCDWSKDGYLTYPSKWEQSCFNTELFR